MLDLYISRRNASAVKMSRLTFEPIPCHRSPPRRTQTVSFIKLNDTLLFPDPPNKEFQGKNLPFSTTYLSKTVFITL